MSDTVTVKVRVAAGKNGRKQLKPARAALDPPRERIPRVARLLALAHRWNDLIHAGAIRNRAELARLVGVSRARISQVMRLLDLAPDIQEAVLDGKIDGPGAERALRTLASSPNWVSQRVARERQSGPSSGKVSALASR